MGHSLHHTSSPGSSGMTKEEETQRLSEPEGKGVCSEAVFAGQDSKAAPMNSQWLRLLAQECHKIKQTKVPAQMGEGFTKPHLCLRSYWL